MTEHNEQVAKIISALGDNSAGRRAVLRAVAKLPGFEDEDAVEDMLHGRSDQKIEVPSSLRGAFNEIGLAHVMAPVNLTMVTEKGNQVLMSSEASEVIEFEVALDNGSTDHACHSADVPGYVVEASPGSRAGQGFIVGNGARVPNDSQPLLNLQATNNNIMATTFQVAKVSGPLMSVGRLCDAGMDFIFKKDRADVLATDGSAILSFERKSGGLHVACLKLKKPAPVLGRQG